METTKLTKEDLKSPDAFISTMDQITHWAYERRMIIIGSVVVLLAIGVVWAAMGTYASRTEDQAQETLFTAEKKMKTSDEAFVAKPEEKPSKPGEAAKPAVPAKARTTLEEDYKDTVPALKEVISKFPNTNAATIAALDLSHLQVEYKKYDDAVSTLQEALKHATMPTTRAMVLGGLGLAYEAKGDCQNAINQWSEIQKDSRMAPFKGESLVKSALCYEKLNQTDKALATYKMFEDAEKEAKRIGESLASEYGVNPNFPLERQDPKKVRKFQDALSKNTKYQELTGLLSDRAAVKAAKRYMKTVKKGQS